MKPRLSLIVAAIAACLALILKQPVTPDLQGGDSNPDSLSELVTESGGNTSDAGVEAEPAPEPLEEQNEVAEDEVIAVAVDMVPITTRDADATDRAWLAERRKLGPRKPLRRDVIPMPKSGNLILNVKFDDRLRARSDGQGGVSLLGTAGEEAVGKLAEFVAEHRLTFAPRFGAEVGEIAERVERRAAEHSGVAQPDLRGMFVAGAGGIGTIEEAHALATQMNRFAVVEYANLESLSDVPEPPGDIAPPTSDFRPGQSWRGLGSVTGGSSIDYAWSYHGRGDGVRIINIERGYNPDHEDLVDIGIVDYSVGDWTQGDPAAVNASTTDHGTKTFGVLAAPDNGYGVSGAATEAVMVGFVGEYTDNSFGVSVFCPDGSSMGVNDTGRALVIAADKIFQGDVILLEVQASVPENTGRAPAEIREEVFCTTKLATDAGIIVVGAAGNAVPGESGQDFDSALASFVTWRSWGDSGAIIVGAGTPDTNHFKLAYSGYGSRVDVHAWGVNVITTSTGYPLPGADEDQGYGEFNGTSSASAMVAGTVMSVQSAHRARFGDKLDPIPMRDLLIGTGNSQSPSASAPGSIGPAVDAQAAIESFLPNFDPDVIARGSLPISQSFATDLANIDSWDEVRSTNLGAATVSGGKLYLTNAQPGIVNAKTHSIADWHLKIVESTPGLVLSFVLSVIDDEFDGAGFEGYLGMDEMDGVFLSVDGAEWTKVTIPALESQTPGDGKVKHAVSLDSAAIKGGFELVGSVRLRFQRYGPNIPGTNADGWEISDVVIDQDDLGTLEISPAERNVIEGSSVELSAGRRGNSSLATSVQYEVIAKTAIAGVDFPAASGQLVFNPGETEVEFSIDTIGDSLAENTDTFRVVLKNPENGVSIRKPHEAIVRILDNDHAPRVHKIKTGTFVVPDVHPTFPGFSWGPAPIELNVSGIGGTIDALEVKVSDLNLELPEIVDVILESPGGTYCRLMSDVGFGAVHDLNLCFADGQPPIPSNLPTTNGSYSPTDGIAGIDQLRDGSNLQPSVSTLAGYSGEDPNGIWKLHIVEGGFGDTSTSTAGGGVLQGGYELVMSITPGEVGLPILDIPRQEEADRIRFYAWGPAGTTYDIEVSEDLTNWTTRSSATTIGFDTRLTHTVIFDPGESHGRYYLRMREQ